MFTQGIPIAAFQADNLDKEFKRLKDLGVVFTQPPTQAGPVTIAICSDTCGNLIQLYQPPQWLTAWRFLSAYCVVADARPPRARAAARARGRCG